MLENPEPVRAIKANQVKPSRPAAFGGVDEPAAEVADVLLVQRPRLHRVIGESADRLRRHGQRHLLGVEVGAIHAGIGQLNPRQRAAFLHRFSLPGDQGYVVVIPEVKLDIGRDFGRMVDFALFGEDDAPAAMRLHPAHLRRCGRVAIARAVAMGHLIETVLRRDRADGQRLEQRLIMWVHRYFPL